MYSPDDNELIEKQIGFKLDQYDRVNQLFLSWLDKGCDNDLDTMLVWAYHWIRRYYFKKFILFQINTENDAEELNTQCFIKFYQNRHKLKKGHILQIWVNLLCKRTLLDYYRNDKYKFTKIPVEDDFYVFDFLDELINELDHRDLVDLLFKELSSQLPPAFLKILELKIIDQKKNSDIAVEMGLTSRIVAKSLFKAMEKIRKSIIIMNILEERTENYLLFNKKKGYF